MKLSSKYIYIYILLFALIIVACSRKANNDNLVINLNPSNAKPINLQEWCKSIELVQLETVPKSLIASCHKIIEHDGRYYFLDLDQRAVFVFNKLGQFVFSTKDLIGKGPNEYASLVDFNINMLNDEIEILDAPSRKIKVYNLDGSFNRAIQLAPELLPLGHFNPITKDTYVFYTKGGQQRDESLLFYSLKSKKIIKKAGKLPDNVHFLPTTMNVPFHQISEQVHFNYTFPSNSIYLIDKKQFDIIKILELDFGEFNFIIDDLPKKGKKDFYRKFMRDNNKYAFIINIAESDKILFVHFLLHDKIFIAKINKTTRETTICFNDTNSMGQLPPPNLIKDNVLTYVCEPGYLRYVISEELLDNTSKNIISNINESDNPVIIKYTLRDN